MIYWHRYNPRRTKIAYISEAQLRLLSSDEYVNRILAQYTHKVDAYLLKSDSGSFSLEIRYGARDNNYLSLPVNQAMAARAWTEVHNPEIWSE